MKIDLSANRTPEDLVDAIWSMRRDGRRDLLPQVLRLLEHESPTVREEVISLVFVKWSETAERFRLDAIIRNDPDAGVRARAIGALGSLSDDSTRDADVEVLCSLVLDGHEEEQVRKAAYESLEMVVHGLVSVVDDTTDLDEDLDLEWVRSLRRSR